MQPLLRSYALRTLRGLSAVFLIICVLEGMLRWSLQAVGPENLVFLRDGCLLLILAVALGLRWSDRDRRGLLYVALLVGLLLIATARGYTFHRNAMQSLFGLKVFLPIVAGLAFGDRLFDRTQLAGYVWIIWGLAVLGIFLSLAGLDPWKGFEYSVGSLDFEGQREWAIDGVDRFGGFSRASFEAGTQIALFGVLLLGVVSNPVLRASIMALSGLTIFLTTARSAIIAFAVALCVWAIMSFREIRPLRIAFLPVPLLAPAILAAGLCLSTFVDAVASHNREGLGGSSSFVQRAEEVWTDGISQLKDSNSVMLGRGIGNIGSSQKLYEPELYNPADNCALYTLVAFGALGAVIVYSAFLARWWQLLRTSASTNLLCACVSSVFFGVGMTLSAYESSSLSFVFGASLLASSSHLGASTKHLRGRARDSSSNEVSAVLDPESLNSP